MRLYHSLLLLYAGGVATLFANNYEMFTALLTHPRYHDHDGEQPLLLELFTRGGVLSADLRTFLPGYLRRPTPMSDYLCDLVHSLMEDHLLQTNRYEDCFDRFEYIMALVFADLYQKSQRGNSGDFVGQIGRFGWRRASRPENIVQVVADEISKFGTNWWRLKNGLFDGSLDRLNAVKAGFDRLVTKYRLNLF